MSTPHTATRITFHVYVASFGPNTQSMAAGFGVPYDVLNQPHLVYCQLILFMCRYNKHSKSLWSGGFMQFRSPGLLESRSSSTWGDRRLQVVFKPVCLATTPPPLQNVAQLMREVNHRRMNWCLPVGHEAPESVTVPDGWMLTGCRQFRNDTKKKSTNMRLIGLVTSEIHFFFHCFYSQMLDWR